MIVYDWLFSTIGLAYILGSIPFGLILTKLFGVGDIRRIGSGNIGATNVMRTGHKVLGILTLLLDAAKGAAAIFIANYSYNDNYALLAGLIVVIGHVFPVWLRFKGGKGVATTLGVFFGLDWQLGASVCVIWLLVFLFVRISSMASIVSIGYSSIAAYLINGDAAAVLCLLLALLVLFTHRGNIERLLEGTEYSFREKTL